MDAKEWVSGAASAETIAGGDKAPVNVPEDPQAGEEPEEDLPF
jgi:hypothetical protein